MKTLRVLVLVGLTGCGVVGDGWYTDNVRDVDGDGVWSERFGGQDCDDSDPRVTICDADGDGEKGISVGGTDCDDANPAVGAAAVEICNGIDDDCDGLVDDADPDAENLARPTWYRDADGDGFGDTETGLELCEVPAGYTGISGDCDDSRVDVSPAANEFCDSIDHNCDGQATEDAVDMLSFYVDDDGDGFGVDRLAGEQGCPGQAPAGTSENASDCDDSDASVYPGAPEQWYDGVDSDCAGDSDFDQDGDGAAYPGEDCDDDDPTIFPGTPELCDGADNDCDGVVDEIEDVAPFDLNYYYLDADGDLEGAGTPLASCSPVPPSGYVTDSGDCNDNNPSVKPGNPEICDGEDNDCNGIVDDGAANLRTFYIDGDGDGFGDAEVQGCVRQDGWSGFAGDCNDADPTVYPGAFEVCGDSVQQDCDLPAPAFDCDGDGVDGAYAANNQSGADCNDASAITQPGAPEICDGIDNDCDGLVDNPPTEPVDQLAYYLDRDGDGFGSGARVFPRSCDEAVGYVTNNADCNDLNAGVYPDAPELCDGIDNDCNGLVDQGLIAQPAQYHLDLDQDGFGDPNVIYAQSCEPPIDGRSWVRDASDCADSDPTIRPSAQETCDGIDNDCDGLIDDQDTDSAGVVWFADADGDGFGAGAPVSACNQPAGHVSSNTDCDDTRADLNPGVEERCDSIDNDCDGRIDGADDSVVGNLLWYPDNDGDGYGEAGSTAVESCVAPALHVANDADCDDAAAGLSPAAAETCDGIDNDCDGLIDDADAVAGAPLWFLDTDGDGYGDVNEPLFACLPPANTSDNFADCDDLDIEVNPSASERCDGIDNDCDGQLDDADPDVTDNIEWYQDADSDGAGDPTVQLVQCGRPDGYVDNDWDCDDATAARSPFMLEFCDNADNDCDGLVDDADPEIFLAPQFQQDADGDGYGAGQAVAACIVPGPDWVEASPLEDCDDADPSRYPFATETCDDLVDSDCDGGDSSVDGALLLGTVSYYFDNDGDGEPGTTTLVCRSVGDADPNLFSTGPDCNDDDPTVIHSGNLRVGPNQTASSLQTAIANACPGGSPTFTLAEPIDESVLLSRTDIFVTLDGANHPWTSGSGNCLQVNDTALVAQNLDISGCNGRGLYVINGDITLNDSLIHDNTWTGAGAGIELSGFSVLNFENGELFGNVSDYRGGGMLVSSNATANLTNVTVYQNRALEAGGIHNLGFLNMIGGAVAENTATNDVGGVWFLGARSDGLFDGTEFAANQSPLVAAFKADSRSRLYNARMTGNQGASIVEMPLGTLSNVVSEGNVASGPAYQANFIEYLTSRNDQGSYVVESQNLTFIDVRNAVGSAVHGTGQAADITALGATGDGLVMDCVNSLNGVVAGAVGGSALVVTSWQDTCTTTSLSQRIQATLIGPGAGLEINGNTASAGEAWVVFANGADPDFTGAARVGIQGNCWTDLPDGTSSACLQEQPDFYRYQASLTPEFWDLAAFTTRVDPYRIAYGHYGSLSALNYTEDGDRDGLPDGWETAWLGDTASSGFDDSDGDGLDNLTEYSVTRSHPLEGDTDGDGAGDATDAQPLNGEVQ